MATTATVAVTTVGPPSTAPQHAEEEAAKKKNTDCVYFLASPLTCKKGDDCEFRHSESARLNPRDCWFWVAGNCRNRECPFRHPPLETRPAAPTPSPPVQQKKPVPCYFFSQGCCAKGSKCQYLHENATSNAMVYRLSDSSKPPPAADPSKTKLAKEESEPVQQQSTTPREHTPDKRKDNVYRLQGKAAAGPSKETCEDEQLPGKQRGGKSHKDSFTWKLSDSPAAQKQPTVDGKDQQRKPEKPVRGNANNNSNNTSSSKRRESRSESSRSSDRTQVVDGGEVNEDFAGPKSLAQIKEEKRKIGDVEDTGSAPAVKFKRKSAPVEGGDEKGEHVRRRLCNGSDATTATATASTTATITTAATTTTTTTATENGGTDVDMSSAELAASEFHVEYSVDCQQQEDEDDDDFARRLGGLFS